MVPPSDGIPARRFPFVNVALIAANFDVLIFYELPNSTNRSELLRDARARASSPERA